MGKSEAVEKPTIFVIFGASGDLTKRKLIPALFNQSIKGRLPKNFQVVGFARRPYDHDAFRAQMLDGMKERTRSSGRISASESGTCRAI